MFRGRFGEQQQLDILVVCTANICRSPYIALRMQAERPDLRIASAGIAAQHDRPMSEDMARLLGARGQLPDKPHVARPLTRAMLRSAALVITATQAHRVAAVRMDRTAGRRSVTLKELARTAAGLPADVLLADLGTAVAVVALADTRDHNDDLGDPWGGPPTGYRRMAEEVDAALLEVLPVLRTRISR